MLVSAQSQIRTPWAPASPSYLQYATFWDAGWYRDIATFGYPTVLPVDAAGHVQSNPWAFMPVYPGLVRAIQDVTGAPFDVAGVAVSLVAGAGAVLVLHRLLSRSLSPSATMTAVVIVCVAPVSPMFQIAYAESLQTLLLLTALLLLVERRYAMLAPVAVVMALTRPLGLAFALALLLHGVHRLATARRDPFPPGERARLVLATTAAGAAGAAWPVVAWIRTGSITAYTDTEPLLAGRLRRVPPSRAVRGLVRRGRLLDRRRRRHRGRPGRRRGVRPHPHPALRPRPRPRAAHLGRLLRPLPPRRLLPAVERVPPAAPDDPVGRRPRRAALACLPRRGGARDGRRPVALDRPRLAGHRGGLDAAVTPPPGASARPSTDAEGPEGPSTTPRVHAGACAYGIMEPHPRKGSRMAAMKPRTGDGPMEAVKEGRLIIVRVPLEGGGRLVVSVNDAEAKELHDALAAVTSAS
ncbi:DUF3117 domain-containing protein [Clavibacter tessellarius]|uniref:DUF3117 domain-containing protein n=1 Tax=Clavibacter tessellarius TaxID=31965 RepID=UPI0032521695